MLKKFLLIFLLVSCQQQKSATEKYFLQNEWNFPVHIIKAKPEAYNLESGKFIDGFEVSPYLGYFEQSVKLLKERIKEKNGGAFVIEKPLIYLDENDTLYSIGVSSYINNSEASDIPCEGCEDLQNKQIWKSGNRAVFKISRKGKLVFKNWEN